MKTNKIIRKQSVNRGSMFTLTFESPVADFDTDQIGGQILNVMGDEINVIETSLNVGDAITDDFGGEPVVSATHGQTEEVRGMARKASDYRDAFHQKNDRRGRTLKTSKTSKTQRAAWRKWADKNRQSANANRRKWAQSKRGRAWQKANQKRRNAARDEWRKRRRAKGLSVT